MRLISLMLAALLLASCQSVLPGKQTELAAAGAPTRDYDLASLRQSAVLSDPAIRFFPASSPDMMQVTGWALSGLPDLNDGTFDVLALSSGGPDGAFGVGVLNGMNARGARPDYEVVTGVSTGALMAPYAFLGANYDRTLRDLYTGKTLNGLVGAPNLFRAMAGGPLYKPTRLKRLIDRLVTRDMLTAIALKHRKGHRLYVATANLDSDDLTVWDMGRIATKGTPEAEALFKDVLMAAVSIPGAFSPVKVNAMTASGPIAELHGDGAVVANFYADTALVPIAYRDKARIDVIIHNVLRPEPKAQNASLVPIVRDSVSSLSRSATRALLGRVLAEGRGANVSVRYASLPPSWNLVTALDIDQAYMTEVYNYGFNAAGSDAVWQTGKP